MASLKDVAREAGVSVSTASRALSGHRKVNEETRATVHDVAERLGYRRNVVARSLRTQVTQSIGLVIPDITNYFYVSGAAVIQSALDAKDYRLVLSMSNDDPDTDLDCLRAALDMRTDGIVHVPCTQEGAEPLVGSGAVPLVELNRRSLGGSFDAVLSDECEGARKLVELLIERGHSRIAMIAGSERLSTTYDRVSGFRDAHRDAGLELDEELLMRGDYAPNWGATATNALLDRDARMTAVFASGSQLVLGSLLAIQKRGLAIPRDISLVGFGDPSWFSVCRPAITTWALPLREMGMIAAQLMLARIRRDASLSATPTVMRLSGRLVLRASVGRPPSRPS